MESNISAKLVALVTDKRREFERGAGRAMAAGAFQEYPSDATDTKEYCQNTAEAGASEFHFVFDPATKTKRHTLVSPRMGLCRERSKVAARKAMTPDGLRGCPSIH